VLKERTRKRVRRIEMYEPVAVVRIPSVRIDRLIQHVPVSVVACPRQSIAVGRLIVPRQPAKRPAFADVAEGIEAECLRKGASAVGAGNARQIVVTVIAGLRVARMAQRVVTGRTRCRPLDC